MPHEEYNHSSHDSAPLVRAVHLQETLKEHLQSSDLLS